MKIFKKYFHLVKGWKLVLFLFMTIISSVCALATPRLMGDFIDNCILGNTTDFILTYSIVFIFLSLTILIVNFISILLNMNIQAKAAYKNNILLINHLNNISPKHFGKFDIAYLTQRVNEDANAVVIFCINTLQELLINSVTIVTTFVLIFLFNQIIAIVYIIIIALYVFVYKMFKQRLYKAKLDLQESQNSFFSQLYNQLLYSKFIRINNVGNIFKNRLNLFFERLINKIIKNQKINYAYSAFDSLVNMISTLSLIVFGGLMLITENITIGSFTIAYTYLNYMFRATKYFLSLGQSYQNALVSFNRIEELMQFEKLNSGNISLERVHKISVQNLIFGYDNNSTFDYQDITFEPGKVYCIKGANGVGKSTFLEVMIGLYGNDYEGIIKFNDTNLNEINLDELKERNLSVLSYYNELIDGITIREFLQIGNNNYDLKQLKLLCELLCLNDLIDSLKDGMDTTITDHGKCFSNGEQQKLSILRVLLKNADVILMDEPTSATDIRSKRNLINYFNKIKSDKIIILITHDPDVILQSDEVIDMDYLSKNHIKKMERPASPKIALL